jgi:hypothetical protein
MLVNFNLIWKTFLCFFVIFHKLRIDQLVMGSYLCVNLPQCKTDNSHCVAKAGDIYTLQIVAWTWNIHTSATQPALIAKTRVVTGQRPPSRLEYKDAGLRHASMIHGYAAYKWKSALLATPQPAPPEFASITTLLKGRKNGPFQGPTFQVTASQLVATQNALPGIQQAHSAWNKLALHKAPVLTGLLRKCTCLWLWISTSHTWINTVCI